METAGTSLRTFPANPFEFVRQIQPETIILDTQSRFFFSKSLKHRLIVPQDGRLTRRLLQISNRLCIIRSM
jgi:hypothetical protein